MKDSGPNWGLAFGSGSFLIVWCLGFLSGVALETIALRSCAATIMGALLGILVGQTLEGIRSLKEDLKKKGSQLDLTVSASDEEQVVPESKESREAREAVVPQAMTPPPAAPPVDEAFQPMDFKKAARTVQSSLKD